VPGSGRTHDEYWISYDRIPAFFIPNYELAHGGMPWEFSENSLAIVSIANRELGKILPISVHVVQLPSDDSTSRAPTPRIRMQETIPLILGDWRRLRPLFQSLIQTILYCI
jgi:hypothetical protein